MAVTGIGWKLYEGPSSCSYRKLNKPPIELKCYEITIACKSPVQKPCPRPCVKALQGQPTKLYHIAIGLYSFAIKGLEEYLREKVSL